MRAKSVNILFKTLDNVGEAIFEEGVLTLAYYNSNTSLRMEKEGKVTTTDYQGWVLFWPSSFIDADKHTFSEQFSSEFSGPHKVWVEDQNGKEKTGVAFQHDLFFKESTEENNYFQKVKKGIYDFLNAFTNPANGDPWLKFNEATSEINDLPSFIAFFNPNDQESIPLKPLPKYLRDYSFNESTFKNGSAYNAEIDHRLKSLKAKHSGIAITSFIIATLFFTATAFTLTALATLVNQQGTDIALQAFQSLSQSFAVSVDILVGLATIACIAVTIASLTIGFKSAAIAKNASKKVNSNEEEIVSDAIKKEKTSLQKNQKLFFYKVGLVFSIITGMTAIAVFVMGITSIVTGSGIDTGAFGALVEKTGLSKMAAVFSELALGIVTAASFFIATLMVYIAYRIVKSIDEIYINKGQISLAEKTNEFFKSLKASIEDRLTSLFPRENNNVIVPDLVGSSVDGSQKNSTDGVVGNFSPSLVNNTIASSNKDKQDANVSYSVSSDDAEILDNNFSAHEQNDDDEQSEEESVSSSQEGQGTRRRGSYSENSSANSSRRNSIDNAKTSDENCSDREREQNDDDEQPELQNRQLNEEKKINSPRF